MLDRFKFPDTKSDEYLKKIEESLELISFPKQVLVEPTAFCNLHCDQCGHENMKRKKGNMSIELFKKIVDEIAETNPETEIWLAHYGESLIVGDNLIEFIKYATSKGVTNTFLNTNAMLLTTERAKQLHDAGLKRIIVGFDGLSKEVYESIRCGSVYEKVKQNVIDVSTLMQTEKWERPDLILQFIVQEKNRHELDEFIKFWHGKNVPVKIRERLTWTGAVKASNLTLKDKRIPCPWGIRTTAITWDGNMHICPADYEAEISLGNINKETIKENWDKGESFRKLHLERKYDDIPDICKPCQDWEAVGAVILFPDGKVEGLK